VGQKVNPIGFRTGITRPWASRWYAKADYAKLLQDDIVIRKFITKTYETAGVSKVEIERAAANLRVNIFSSRPGIIIGKKGAGAESLKEKLGKVIKSGYGELSVNVFEVQKPDLDANLVAQNVKQQLERRISFRRAMKKCIGASMKAGAKGIKVQCGGRLGGAEMARTERYHEGRVPLHTIRADIDYGTAEALTTYGIIGIKVWIFKGEILPGSKN
jgi:small subunit ribosomal protein S3